MLKKSKLISAILYIEDCLFGIPGTLQIVWLNLDYTSKTLVTRVPDVMILSHKQYVMSAKQILHDWFIILKRFKELTQ